MRYLIGTVMNKKASLLILLVSFLHSANAEISVPISGVPLEESSIIESYKSLGEKSSFVPGEEHIVEKVKSSKTSFHLSGSGLEVGLDQEVSEIEKIKSLGITLPGNLGARNSYYTLSNEQLLAKFQDKGVSSFSFFYLQDTYDVQDGGGIFQRTFGENQPKSMRGGALHFSSDQYWVHDNYYFGWQINFGIGLSQGNGSFTSNGVSLERSQTKFSLWTLPLDIGLVYELPVGKWFKLGIAGGPSVMGIYQHRNDKENSEGGKHIRQGSIGYYGKANFKVSMSHVMPLQAVRNLRAYDMTKMYLTFEARFQEFSNFQDDLSISGTSFGLGLSFEYL